MIYTKRVSRILSILMTFCLMMTMLVTPVSAATKTSGKVGAVKWNSTKKTVSFEVTVNKNMLDGKAVEHFIINDKNGKTQTINAGAGLFSTKATALDLYNALVKAGATPWAAKGQAVASLDTGAKLSDVPTGNLANPGFSRLTMTFKKGGKSYKPEQLVNYEYKGTGTAVANPFNMCFSGNYDNQKAWNTGCVACLFSCFAGVTSNAAIGYGTTNDAENYFYAGSKLKAGDKYTVTYKIAKAPYNYITSQEVMKNMSKYRIVDVREAAKIEETGHVNGSIVAPVPGHIATSTEGIANLKKVVEKFGKNTKYVIVCNSGNSYAQAATSILTKDCGVKAANVYTLVRGWADWSKLYPEWVVE